ncbi:hypothetical protein PAMP_017819 [Pampus punctatissimus]
MSLQAWPAKRREATPALAKREADLFSMLSANPCEFPPSRAALPAPLLFTPTHITSVGLLPYSSPPGMCCMKADAHTCRYVDPVSVSQIGRLP